MSRSACTLLVQLCMLLLAGGRSIADESSVQVASDSTAGGVNAGRLAMLAGTGGALHYLGFRYFDDAWYRGQKQDHIRWAYDWSGETYLNLDKGGHFMGGVVMAQSMQDGLCWAGVAPRVSAALGTLVSWGVLMEIEMRDAYYDQWGFSVPDFTANTLGAAVPLVHALLPGTRIVRFKFSYHPSALYLDRTKRAAADRPHVDDLIDDYEGMTFWLALQLKPLLPRCAAEHWPDYLGLAVGYGATGLHGAHVKSKGPNKYYDDLPDAQPEVFVALDYDARQLPGDGRLWKGVKERLSWFHFPAPTLRIYPSPRLYLFYM